MGGNHGYKLQKRTKHLVKSQNFNKPGKSDKHTRDLDMYGWGGTEKYKDYASREFGIKFKTTDTNFYPDSRENSNMDISHMTEEEIINLNTQLYEDFYKKVPSDWKNLHDKTKWRVEKNHCKNRRRDADMKMDR
jgi:hypothetical protein